MKQTVILISLMVVAPALAAAPKTKTAAAGGARVGVIQCAAGKIALQWRVKTGSNTARFVATNGNRRVRLPCRVRGSAGGQVISCQSKRMMNMAEIALEPANEAGELDGKVKASLFSVLMRGTTSRYRCGYLGRVAANRIQQSDYASVSASPYQLSIVKHRSQVQVFVVWFGGHGPHQSKPLTCQAQRLGRYRCSGRLSIGPWPNKRTKVAVEIDWRSARCRVDGYIASNVIVNGIRTLNRAVCAHWIS